MRDETHEMALMALEAYLELGVPAAALLLERQVLNYSDSYRS